MTPRLESLSDEQLNELFAVEVGGYAWWTFISDDSSRRWAQLHEPNRPWLLDYEKRGYAVRGVVGADKESPKGNIPKYCTSADAVLPWLEKCEPAVVTHWVRQDQGLRWLIYINAHAEGCAPTFARAAVLALLKAHRAQKEKP